VSLGNDVVDLADPESGLECLHPRWIERVFAEPERVALEEAGARRRRRTPGPDARLRLHWALWAAKESAYKARKRTDPATMFSPREFVAELAPLPDGDGTTMGRVDHRGQRLAVEVRIHGSCLHAVATGSEAARAPLLAVATTAGADAGRDVRGLAAATIADALQVDVARLAIAGRPPAIRWDGEPTAFCLSLSHHGRFVAFAALLSGLLPICQAPRGRA
jgi:phosphopantetheinyl transferase (holo-ACP synthase)